MPDEPGTVELPPDMSSEALAVQNRRYREARKAGLPRIRARDFAASTIDVGLLRKCVKAGWSGEQIARVLL